MPFQKGHLTNFGKKLPMETRQKMSEAHRGMNPASWGAGFKNGNIPWNKAGSRNAYYAGIFDGEGYVGIVTNGASFNGRQYFKPSVRITMKKSDSGEVLEEAQKIWGGSLHDRKPRKSNHSWCLDWSIYTKEAEKFLRDIYPYLRVKKKQVDIFFQFRSLQTSKRCVTNIITTEGQKLRVNLRAQLKQLHHT